MRSVSSVLELTQAKLRTEIVTLAKDEDWGDPRKYDLKIVRNGEGLETSYAMTPSRTRSVVMRLTMR